MRSNLLNSLVCPFCRLPLQMLSATPAPPKDIEQAMLLCPHCGHPFAVDNGIPIMISPLMPRYEEKMREARGWVAISQDKGWYEPTPEIDLALPYPVRKLGWDLTASAGWEATARSWDDMVARYVRPGMRILEIGAARTWCGRYLSDLGCDYIGCDIVTDAKIGLGRSRFFIEHSSHYEVVAADAEMLPFPDAHFDLVFAIAALHHALDLDIMLSEMARVCRPGGIIAGLNEGVRAFTASPDAENQATEKTYGINEHVYSLLDYYRAMSNTGLRVDNFQRAIGYDVLISERAATLATGLQPLPWGDNLAAVAVLGFMHPYDGVTFFAHKPK